MKATAVLPIKRFGSAKSRLSKRLVPEQRAIVAEAMLTDVLAALARAQRVERTILVSGEPRAVAVATAKGVDVLDDDDHGHNEAASKGTDHAAQAGAECVVLLPGDCPFLDPAELDRELSLATPRSVAVIADRHGSGTNGLILRPPTAIRASFGPGSRARHEELARSAGVACRIAAIPSMGLDLDTPADLAELASVLSVDPRRAPRTAAALSRIGATVTPNGEGGEAR